jgi:CHAD domain-containing protein
MPYALEAGEPLADAIPRILVEQVDRAVAQLTDAQKPAEERVHDARKRFKEIRALLRLVRTPLGEHFAIENAWFRDAARDLASARDAQAVIEALDALNGPKRVVAPARRHLVKRRDALHTGDLPARIANALTQLPIAKARLLELPPFEERFATIGDGLERIYGDGRRAFHQALAEPTATNLHEWRKRVKDHWYHAQLLRHVWPAHTKAWREVMEELSDALGDHHDLDVLRALVADEHPDVLPLIDERRTALEATAREIGERVYAEGPGRWRQRMRAYWRAWRR